MASESRLPVQPDTVAELGPGGSIGAGLTALLSGASRYVGLDVVQHLSNERNVRIVDDLLELFRARENIPGDEEFPACYPKLASYEFPHQVLTRERLAWALSQERIDCIRKGLDQLCDASRSHDSVIRYIVPWHDAAVIEEGTVDMVFSQAVLEHVIDLDNAYRAMAKWLRRGGVMSHQVDLTSHENGTWNEHWEYSDLGWRLARGRHPYTLNRQPHSTHVAFHSKYGFRIVCDAKTKDTEGTPRHKLNRKYRDLSGEDLTTKKCFIQAVKQ
jgi:hypothetical protein